jgi:hypothetical protein
LAGEGFRGGGGGGGVGFLPEDGFLDAGYLEDGSGDGARDFSGEGGPVSRREKLGGSSNFRQVMEKRNA